MIQALPHNSLSVRKFLSTEEFIRDINNYIDNNSCKNMSVDISFLNILDSCYVSTVCSTKHYVKYPDGKINWKVSSELVREFNSSLELGNAGYEII